VAVVSGETSAQGKCIRLFVLSANRNARFRLSQGKDGMYSAGTATLREEVIDS